MVVLCWTLSYAVDYLRALVQIAVSACGRQVGSSSHNSTDS